MNRMFKWRVIIPLLLAPVITNAQIVLIGDNTPHGVMNDGDFKATVAQWRQGVMAPFWKVVTKDAVDPKTKDQTIGVHEYQLFSSNKEAIAESLVLNTNPDYQIPHEGDILKWEFGADLEYRSNGTISVSLIFGEHERVLTQNTHLKGSDLIIEHFSGLYTLTAEDAAAGLPSIRVKFNSEKGIKLFLDYINISVVDPIRAMTPTINGEVLSGHGIALNWDDKNATDKSSFILYRSLIGEKLYEKLYEGDAKSFEDKSTIAGLKYQYVVTRRDDVESAPSNIVTLTYKDSTAPTAPQNLTKTVYDSEVALTWDKNNEIDFDHYSISRCNPDGSDYVVIADGLKTTHFEDILAPTMVDNVYNIYAHDHSGNKSEPSKSVSARVNIVKGAAFSDLILPMPIVDELSSDLWGAETVLPRDPNNGIESPDWSYWGGHPVYDASDGKYHICVVRWPESALKGHWEWPSSTVAHAISDTPIGPYKVKDELAYTYKNGLGHNADIIHLNDGRFALYSLVDWDPTIFTSESMNGPWKREGVMDIDWESTHSHNAHLSYQYERNLTGVQLEDGRFIIVTKFGATMVSDDGILGTYHIMTDGARENKTIPERYRKWNYEDPVMWRDEVQFHMIINAFIAKRAIYLRSGDGINWVYDPGLAYTPDFTSYENGVVNHWDKLERPHIIQDEYGRATHLSLAVIDVDKRLDYGGDNHNSKNMIIPLRVPLRIEVLSKDRVTSNSSKVSVLIHSDDNFDATKEMDLESLRFGDVSEVNYGRGGKVVKSKRTKEGLRVEFEGVGLGVNEDTFALKLIGRKVDGELIIGYSKLEAK